MACPSLLLAGSPVRSTCQIKTNRSLGSPEMFEFAFWRTSAKLPALSGFKKSISEACRVLVHVLVLLSCGCRLTALSSERHIVQRKCQKRLCYAGRRARNSKLR
jgi:hypothetical protein